MGQAYFCYFQQQFYRKIVDLSGIWTRILGIESEQADHVSTVQDHGHYCAVGCCGIVGTVIASDIRGPSVKASLQQFLLNIPYH